MQCITNILITDPFPFGKIVIYSHLLVHGNIKYPDDRQPKLRTYILEPILDSYEYAPAVSVTMHSMI